MNVVPDIPVHLLGCTLPLEFTLYTEEMKKRIYSIDTSSPVVAAFEGPLYTPLYGVDSKPSLKLDQIFLYNPHDLPEIDGLHLPGPEVEDAITHNIKAFRKLVKGVE
jgi:hypothetical protein